jgi:hypothetical protein
MCGLGSSVGIATELRTGRSGSNPGEGEIFRPFRPAVGPTQPPLKWVPGPSRYKVRPGRAADHSPTPSTEVMEEYSYTSAHPLGQTRPEKESTTFFLLPFCYVSEW